MEAGLSVPRNQRMKRFLHLLIALAVFVGGLWFFYAGYEHSVSLAGKTETGLTYLKTGFDGKTRVLTEHQDYAVGLALIIGSSWWMLHGHKPARGKRSRRR
jgi:heme/copper-type cytochrome/quinol oxidase subunit 4